MLTGNGWKKALFRIEIFSINCPETPLTLATMTPDPVETVMALVSGGAHLDFRNRRSLTPLHTAAQRGNDEAIRVK